jgi:hypothetical protein
MAIIYPQFDDRPLSVDQINNNFRSIDNSFNSINNSLAPSSLRTTVLGTPDEILYSESLLGASQLGTLGSTGSTLLPELPSNKYYHIKEIILEYTEGGVAYEVDGFDPEAIIIFSGRSYTSIYIDPKILTFPDDKIIYALSPGVVPDVNYQFFTNSTTLGSSSTLDITTANGQGFVTGDGTLLIKIWYTIRTWGSEL